MRLLGTIHVDIEGPRRLEKVLRTYSPSVITIEAPNDKSIDELRTIFLGRRERRLQLLRQMNLPSSLERLFADFISSYAYEILVPIEYQRTAGAEVYAVDIPRDISED